MAKHRLAMGGKARNRVLSMASLWGRSQAPFRVASAFRAGPRFIFKRQGVLGLYESKRSEIAKNERLLEVEAQAAEVNQSTGPGAIP